MKIANSLLERPGDYWFATSCAASSRVIVLFFDAPKEGQAEKCATIAAGRHGRHGLEPAGVSVLKKNARVWIGDPGRCASSRNVVGKNSAKRKSRNRLVSNGQCLSAIQRHTQIKKNDNNGECQQNKTHFLNAHVHMHHVCLTAASLITCFSCPG